MSQTLYIKKNTDTKNDLDFDFLKELGIRYIEKLGGEIWTDYNTHDPGITILEMLCYAITDLSQRIDLPIENILSSKENNLQNMHSQFLSAVHILPSKPVSELDYRKLFAYVKGVKNSWIVKCDQPVYSECSTDNLKWSYNPFASSGTDSAYKIKGLNKIYVDLEEGKTIDEVSKNVKKLYHKNRNLCEDLCGIEAVPEQKICICAYIDLEHEADEEEVYAKVVKAIEDYLSPPLKFYSLEEMLKKGYPADEIFEGPVPWDSDCVNSLNLKGGFVDSNELKKTELRTEVRLSDLIRTIMDLKGVKAIKDISINNCDGFNSENISWILCIDENHKPKLNLKKSVIKFTKDLLPVGVNSSRAMSILADLKLKEKKSSKLKIIEDILFPGTSYSSDSKYDTIQEDFPDTYGISSFGLAASSSKQRKAQAKQLKAYLLFFDQVLANYFAQLSKVKDLLSVDENLKKLYVKNEFKNIQEGSEEYKNLTQVYFTQKVRGINGLDDLLEEDFYSENLRDAMQNSLSEKAIKVFYKKRNKLLDHLIARFAERFGEYVFIMKMLDEENYQDKALQAKVNFLNDYQSISCRRGVGFDILNPEIWDTNNVCGAVHRIARLTGIKDYSRRDLLSEIVEVYDVKDKVDDKLIEYRWRIKNKNRILISSSNHYQSKNEAYNEIFLTLKYALEKSNYEINTTQKGDKYYFNLVNPEIADKKSEARIIARRIAYSHQKSKTENICDEIIEFLKKSILEEEGMYLMEHILLRPDIFHVGDNKANLPPDAGSDIFMTSCANSECPACEPVDPYSFRVTVVLPGWTTRFSNIEFRRYFEKIVREELPAHVFPRICWIGDIRGMVPDAENNMLQLQTNYYDYLNFLNKVRSADSPVLNDIKTVRFYLKELIERLYKLYTIYSSGKLYDCNDDDNEHKDNKIFLGRTNIGNH